MARSVLARESAAVECHATIGALPDPQPPDTPEVSWSDTRLIRECLEGNERAWSALIDKYKNLIYSVPIRWGFPQADASDIFQSVVADLLGELANLRAADAMAGWLVKVATHKCIKWRREQMRHAGSDGQEPDPAAGVHGESPEDLLDESRREQILREAIYVASPQCRQLIRMLFYESPTRPYAEVAAQLGIAESSIGFTRRKCLERLRKHLEGAGFASP